MRSTFIIAAASMVIGTAFAQPANTPLNPAPPAAQTEPANPPIVTPPASTDPGREALPRINRDPAQATLPSNPAVKTTEGNNPGAPVAGANSFTEGQAKSRIEAKGYGSVTDLKKDDKGIWRGTAMKDGKAVQISLDYEGNIVVN